MGTKINKPYLKYPVTNLEDLSPKEARKLLDSVRFTPTEETFNIWKILPFILLIAFVCVTIAILAAR